MEQRQKYQLHYAAGLFWLWDTDPSDEVYHPPIPLNESAAELCRILLEGKSIQDASAYMMREYGITVEQAYEDLSAFRKQLAEQGVQIGVEKER